MITDIMQILAQGREMGASDVHITSNSPPVYRINGRLVLPPDANPLTGEDTYRLLQRLVTDTRVWEKITEYGQDDFALSFPGIGRIRVNIYSQRAAYAAAIRLLPTDLPDLETLGLPPVVKELALRETGLLLVTGSTGSGKTTTLAGMINLLNHTKNLNILTLEDPIEYVHEHNTCIVNQREIGSDTVSFAAGLRAALRQDPDVIMVGEMRDLDTISTAVTAAETGHLVLASLHSGNAVQAVERIVDAYPPYQQQQIRNQLAATLQGIIHQELIPRNDNRGRVVAAEVLVATPAAKNLIRENKINQLYSVMQTGSAVGMITMDKSLAILLQSQIISPLEYAQRLTVKPGLIEGDYSGFRIPGKGQAGAFEKGHTAVGQL
ncbi:MAG: type IV pilus twitching motility protein PilT [Syntrophomonadaceae bacterium]|jgi:twitching motility protein PilT